MGFVATLALAAFFYGIGRSVVDAAFVVGAAAFFDAGFEPETMHMHVRSWLLRPIVLVANAVIVLGLGAVALGRLRSWVGDPEITYLRTRSGEVQVLGLSASETSRWLGLLGLVGMPIRVFLGFVLLDVMHGSADETADLAAFRTTAVLQLGAMMGVLAGVAGLLAGQIGTRIYSAVARRVPALRIRVWAWSDGAEQVAIPGPAQEPTASCAPSASVG